MEERLPVSGLEAGLEVTLSPPPPGVEGPETSGLRLSREDAPPPLMGCSRLDTDSITSGGVTLATVPDP